MFREIKAQRLVQFPATAIVTPDALVYVAELLEKTAGAA